MSDCIGTGCKREGLQAEIARLKADLESVRKWQEEGESLFARGESASVMFCLGAWWADRPWRDVPRAKP